MITSVHNPRIKHLVRLRERRYREREGRILIEGAAEVELALDSGVPLQTLFLCASLATSASAPLLLDRLRQSGVEVVVVAPNVFTKIAYRENPDGWLAVAPFPRRRLADLDMTLATLSPPPLLLVAETIEKPGNLGAMLRTADAAGITAFILCDPHTDLSNPNVVRSSRGALFSVPLAEASSHETLAWLKQHNIALLAATPQATIPYTHTDLRGPVAIAVGEEKHGLSPLWLEQADLQVRIPMRGRVNSLNVATAAALLIYEALRQRQTV